MESRIYPNANCVICGKEFPKTRIDRMCCSGSCATKNSATKSEKKKNKTKSNYVKVSHPEKPCLICGEKFKPKHFDTNLCSKKCLKARKEALRKEKNKIITMLDGRAPRYKNTEDQTKTKRAARAIAYKNIHEMKPCEACGKTERVHRHHDDYSKPLEVRFLCCQCHNKWHKYNQPKF